MLDNARILAYLRAAQERPSDQAALDQWLSGVDALAFLDGTKSETVPIYVSVPGLFVHGVFIPNSRLQGEYWHDLLGWNFGVSSGWGYGLRRRDPDEESDLANDTDTLVPTLFHPLDHTATRTADAAEPIVYSRFFEGAPDPSHVDLAQRIEHVSGAHYVVERQAYAKLNDDGEYEDVAKLDRVAGRPVFSIDGQVLDLFGFLSQQTLVRFFEIQRWRDPDRPHEHHRDETLSIDPDSGLLFRRTTIFADESNTPSIVIVRGFQLVPISESPERLMQVIKGDRVEPKTYATFIIHDLKTGTTKEWTCDPAQLGNYFVESDLPLETSPVFFKPEVLLKYKAAPDKYELSPRAISRRGSWRLAPYDINDEGQVFTYLVYLGDLPHSEQLYWKSFNEPPKGGISGRAWTTDFAAEWWTGGDPLPELKEMLKSFPTANHNGVEVAVWSMGPGDHEDEFAQAQYVVTETPKEWRDEILGLAKLVVEPIRKPTIRKVARALGCDDPGLGSLRLLREVLLGRGTDPDVVEEVCNPLQDLWYSRSAEGPAHRGTGRRIGLREDYRRRVDDILSGMQLFAHLVRRGALNLP